MRFRVAAAEQGGNDLKGFKDFRTENGPSRGHNLALTGLFGRSSLDSGFYVPCTFTQNCMHIIVCKATLQTRFMQSKLCG